MLTHNAILCSFVAISITHARPFFGGTSDISRRGLVENSGVNDGPLGPVKTVRLAASSQLDVVKDRICSSAKVGDVLPEQCRNDHLLPPNPTTLAAAVCDISMLNDVTNKAKIAEMKLLSIQRKLEKATQQAQQIEQNAKDPTALQNNIDLLGRQAEARQSDAASLKDHVADLEKKVAEHRDEMINAGATDTHLAAAVDSVKGISSEAASVPKRILTRGEATVDAHADVKIDVCGNVEIDGVMSIDCKGGLSESHILPSLQSCEHDERYQTQVRRFRSTEEQKKDAQSRLGFAQDKLQDMIAKNPGVVELQNKQAQLHSQISVLERIVKDLKHKIVDLEHLVAQYQRNDVNIDVIAASAQQMPAELFEMKRRAEVSVALSAGGSEHMAESHNEFADFAHTIADRPGSNVHQGAQTVGKKGERIEAVAEDTEGHLHDELINEVESRLHVLLAEISNIIRKRDGPEGVEQKLVPARGF